MWLYVLMLTHDHIGEDGIDTVEEMGMLKRSVMKRASASSCSFLTQNQKPPPEIRCSLPLGFSVERASMGVRRTV